MLDEKNRDAEAADLEQRGRSAPSPRRSCPETGSSSSSIEGLAASASATPSRRWSPYGSAPPVRRPPLDPDQAQDFPGALGHRAAPRAQRPAMPAAFPRSVGRAARCRPIRTFSSTVLFGNTLVRWNVRTRPSAATWCGFRPFSGAAAKRDHARPSAAENPVMTLNAVVLPAPFDPIRPTVSPSRP